jgi:hypothetical protein
MINFRQLTLYKFLQGRPALIGFFLLLCSSCTFTVETEKPDQTDELGEMPRVSSIFFKNIYIANERTCGSRKLPITRFAIEYPDSLDVSFPNNGRDHLSIKSRNKDNIVTEELSIGNTTLKLNKHEVALNLLENLVDQFKKQLPDMKIINIGKEEFKGTLTYLFKAEVDFSSFKEKGYYGKYRILGMIPFPKTNNELNAILVTFVANEESEIDDFKDFENKGLIAKLWNTFRYIE